MRTLQASVFLSLLFTAVHGTAFAQMTPYPGGGGRGGGVGLPPPVPELNKEPRDNKQKSPDESLPSFAGTVRGIDSKALTLERPDANTLEFNCSKKTKYYDGSKKVKASAIKPGDRVSVEAKRAPDGTLDAVNVRLERQKSS
jgi:hypothetical protein